VYILKQEDIFSLGLNLDFKLKIYRKSKSEGERGDIVQRGFRRLQVVQGNDLKFGVALSTAIASPYIYIVLLQPVGV
jgi:hypothetical protein